jgi:hypothetical protein
VRGIIIGNINKKDRKGMKWKRGKKRKEGRREGYKSLYNKWMVFLLNLQWTLYCFYTRTEAYLIAVLL